MFQVWFDLNRASDVRETEYHVMIDFDDVGWEEAAIPEDIPSVVAVSVSKLKTGNVGTEILFITKRRKLFSYGG